jgi:adenylate cyclase
MESRRLAAIMFTDIVGYTALTQSDESRALELLERHNMLLRPIFPKYHGREVKTIGDSFLVEFDSALDASNCAVEIQNVLHNYNSSSEDMWKIKLRIGIHLGDVIHRGSDVLGDAVNIASRIEPIAEPEGICVSQQVYDQVHNKKACRFRLLEQTELKNVSTSINVYAVILPWNEERGTRGLTKLYPNRIAVLPFSSFSPDLQDEYFADGMTEEVISTISKIQGLEVISRTSVMQYKKASKPIKEISKELEAGTILEGSVRKAGNKLRVSAQMIDAERDRHLWAESYDRELEDVFAIQTDIAAKVADVLQARFLRSISETQSTGDIQAYTTYLKAMQNYHQNTESSMREAITLFEQAISMDKRFARAYAGLAHAWGRMATAGYEDFEVAVRKAEIAAKKALQLAPDSAEAHAALADAYAYIDRCAESMSEAEKAIALNPNLSQAHISLGSNLFSTGRTEDGLLELERAHELDPLSISTADHIVYALIALGKTSDALSILQKFRELNPDNPVVYEMLADCYMEREEFFEAQQMLDQCVRLSPDEPRGKLGQALLYAYTGKSKEAEGKLRELSESEAESIYLWGQFFVQTALGNFDEAFQALMRMADTHAWPFQIKSMSELKQLRKDPRFVEFCKKVGIPP